MKSTIHKVPVATPPAFIAGQLVCSEDNPSMVVLVQQMAGVPCPAENTFFGVWVSGDAPLGTASTYFLKKQFIRFTGELHLSNS